MQVVAIIPARGGSKGIPRKNLVDIGGLPMIAWTIRAAIGSGVIDRTILSTDDPEIAETAQRFGAEIPGLRPPELATDSSPTLSVVRHALAEYARDADTVVLLQPTSPLRVADDIANAMQLYRQTGRSVVGVTKAKPPSWLFRRDADGTLARAIPDLDVDPLRQMQDVVIPNGAIYIGRTSLLLNGGSFYDDAVGYMMPPERSVDVDDLFDLHVVRSTFDQPEVRDSGERI